MHVWHAGEVGQGVVIVILETACGCRKAFDAPDRIKEIVVHVKGQPTIMGRPFFSGPEFFTRTRTFRLYGAERNRKGEQTPIYREVLE